MSLQRKTSSRYGCNKFYGGTRNWYSRWTSKRRFANGLLMISTVFYYREEHQTIRTVQPTEYALHVAAVSSSSAHASTVIGTLNQDLLITPPYPVSVKSGEASFPNNRSLVSFSTVTPFAFTSHSLHYRYHPTIAELDPMDYNAVQYIRFNASSSIVNGHIHEHLLEDSNIRDLEAWALAALPLC
ncbi:uncharacterized protein LACBIDRAFT_323910 [Laccaria bicolor S238N-H82]|uniref:Predicted protein n=1 Tax=Laccaria bicolor (strain S238N-H82 / ATCC MYA-4686) TaxID=486041 RepID=B0D016_LACBS|nr:uncharacterized protein LACBIDRAFT_323910 [Laccaria bicolor S238N-H82]EDR11748.1 predicted protein [Laccaria bicolor S238N-H82]|eukprot:XP_001877645.1 predicted protein [Laccaria bicolor S238N-H82]